MKTPTGRVPGRDPGRPGPQQPVFYTGKVVLDNGNPPPGPVSIIRVCNGSTRRQTYAVSDGSFSFSVGDINFSETTADVTDDNRGFGPDSSLSRGIVTVPGQTNSQLLMADCEVKAELTGYSSSAIRLDPTMNNSNIGVIVLHSRTKKAEGMVTVASLEVPSKARREYERGSEELEKGNLQEAEKSLRKAIGQYPQFAEAWTRLGDLEQRRKDPQAAMKNYQEAIDADPKLPLPYLRLAYLQAVNRNWEETRKLSEKLISLDPSDFALGYYYNAVAEFNLKHLAKAETSALRAETMDQRHAEPRIELLLASIYTSKDAFGTAAEHYRAYLKLVPAGPLTDAVKTDLAKLEQMAKSQPAHAPEASK